MKKVELKENYYGDKILSYLVLLVVGAVIILALFFMQMFIFEQEPKPQYFVTNDNDQIFAGDPLDKQVYNDPQLRDWIAQSVIKLFSFNFINYDTELLNNKKLFTNDGFVKYINLVKDSDLKFTLARKFIVKASLCDVVAIKKEDTGVYNIDGTNKYVWTVTVPLLIQYANKQDSYQLVSKVEARIERMSELVYVDGLAISDIDILARADIHSGGRSSLPVCNGM